VGSSPDAIGGDHSGGVGGPRHDLGIGSDPLSRGEGEADHEEGADEFVEEVGEVFAVGDEGGGEACGEARGEVG